MDAVYAGQLAQKAQTGDQTALNELIGALYNKVYAIAMKNLGNEYDAADVAQNTFIRLYRGIGGLRDVRTLYGWISRIALNECHRYIVRRRELAVSAEAIESISGEGACYYDSPFDGADEYAGVSQAVIQLPLKQRLAVELYYYKQYSISDTARMMCCSVPMTKKYLFKARAALRLMLREEYSGGREAVAAERKLS